MDRVLSGQLEGISCVCKKSGQLEASPDAMPGTAIPVVGDSLCSGRDDSGFPIHSASAQSEGFEAAPFCLHCVVWGFNG